MEWQRRGGHEELETGDALEATTGITVGSSVGERWRFEVR